MLRAGDVNGGLRDLKAYVDANPGNRAARQRIGTAVADRARELQSKGSREQALALYEQAVALRGEATPEWTAQMQVAAQGAVGRVLQQRRARVPDATSRWRSSSGRRASSTTRRTSRHRRGCATRARAQEKLKRIAALRREVATAISGGAASRGAAPPNFSVIFFLQVEARSRSSLAFWLFGIESRARGPTW